MQIDWLGHDGIRVIADGLVIYFDPYQIEGGAPADILLVSHEHFDHCSLEDIDKIRTPDTMVLCSTGCKIADPVTRLKPGEKMTVRGMAVEAVPSYNTNKPNHPKSSDGLGFVITVENTRIYHAGDTDLIPEMSELQCDVALLPVSGTYVMDAGEAAQAARRIKPKIAIPIHYGAGIVGTKEDAIQFRNLLEDTDIKVELKEKSV